MTDDILQNLQRSLELIDEIEAEVRVTSADLVECMTSIIHKFPDIFQYENTIRELDCGDEIMEEILELRSMCDAALRAAAEYGKGGNAECRN